MPLTPLPNNFYALSVPESGNRFHIFNDEQPYLFLFIGAETQRIYLPEGKWGIVSKADEISEEQAAQIVEVLEGSEEYYRLYSRTEWMGPVNAIESLRTLIVSLGLNTSQTLIIKKQ